MKLTLKEWNQSLDYASERREELKKEGHNLEVCSYTMSNGTKGIRFFVLDNQGNRFESIFSGIQNTLEEMKQAIDSMVRRVKKYY